MTDLIPTASAVCKNARLAVHRPSACSGVKGPKHKLRYGGEAAGAASVSVPLPLPRAGILNAGDGTKNGLPAAVRLRKKKPLDVNNPITEATCLIFGVQLTSLQSRYVRPIWHHVPSQGLARCLRKLSHA